MEQALEKTKNKDLLEALELGESVQSGNMKIEPVPAHSLESQVFIVTALRICTRSHAHATRARTDTHTPRERARILTHARAHSPAGPPRLGSKDSVSNC